MSQKTKIIVELEGGLVQGIITNNPNIDVLVIDKDVEGADSDEFIEDSEIKGFCEQEKLKYIDFKSGISDTDLSNLIK